ncbi:MAG: low temperature requirement protein [Schumannella sp.]|nr:low temperature requirement protein [Schumannella sp.]
MTIKNPFTSRLLAAETSREGDRATTLELFFDLIYVFAFTQVSALMSAGHDGIAVLEGLVVLALIWWSWTSYTWLANQAHADREVVRIAIVLAIALVFLVSLVIPEAYADLRGGLFAPMVFVICLVAVRVVHAVTYVVAAGSDAGLRRQVIVSMSAALVPASALLVIGALVGAPYQVWIWLVAIVLDLAVVYLTSRGGNWRLNSIAHFSERHSLVVILALGESVVAIGIGVGHEPVSTAIIVGSVLAVGLAVGMWWVYFHHFAPKTEHLIGQRSGVERAGVATDVYTYLHLSLVAGVVVAALGVEQAMAQRRGNALARTVRGVRAGRRSRHVHRRDGIHLAARGRGVGADPIRRSDPVRAADPGARAASRDRVARRGRHRRRGDRRRRAVLRCARQDPDAGRDAGPLADRVRCGGFSRPGRLRSAAPCCRDRGTGRRSRHRER